MQDEGFGERLGGEVEIDETFIGGKARNMYKERRLRALEAKAVASSGRSAPREEARRA
jgi:hypothetical protein